MHRSARQCIMQAGGRADGQTGRQAVGHGETGRKAGGQAGRQAGGNREKGYSPGTGRGSSGSGPLSIMGSANHLLCTLATTESTTTVPAGVKGLKRPCTCTVLTDVTLCSLGSESAWLALPGGAAHTQSPTLRSAARAQRRWPLPAGPKNGTKWSGLRVRRMVVLQLAQLP